MISIYWIFALKYWSVSIKFELVVAEKEITKWNWLVDSFLIGGLVLLTAAQTVETYENVKSIKSTIEKSSDAETVVSQEARLFSYTEVIVMALACVILFDAMRRIRGTNIQNSTI
jgi:hypothetical protein